MFFVCIRCKSLLQTLAFSREKKKVAALCKKNSNKWCKVQKRLLYDPSVLNSFSRTIVLASYDAGTHEQGQAVCAIGSVQSLRVFLDKESLRVVPP